MVTYPFQMTSRMQDYISKYFFLKNTPGYLFNYSDMIAKNKAKFYNPLIPQRYYLQKAQVSDKQKSTNTWLCQKIHLP